MEAVLAIDLGSTWVKAALFDSAGRRATDPVVREPCRVESGADGSATIEPEACFRAVVTALDRATRGVRTPLAACGLSAFWHSLVGVGGDGAPVTPILTWADARARAEGAQLEHEPGWATLAARTGNVPASISWAARLRWARSVSPFDSDRVWRWMSAAEWIHGRLCGEWRCAVGMAAATGLMDRERMDWEADMLARAGVDRSRLNPIDNRPGRLAAAWRTRFPMLAEALFVPAIGDGAAGTLGSGVHGPGRLAVNLGTSAAVRRWAGADEPPAPDGCFDYRIDRDWRVIGKAFSNAGNALEWTRRLLGLDANRAYAALRDFPPGSGGLGAMPDWVAERSAPMYAGASIVGLRPVIDPVAVLDAMLLAVLGRIAQGVRLLDPDGRARPVVSGGLAREPAVLDRLSRLLGRNVASLSDPEASLRGAALQALRLLGHTVGGAPGLEQPSS